MPAGINPRFAPIGAFHTGMWHNSPRLAGGHGPGRSGESPSLGEMVRFTTRNGMQGRRGVKLWTGWKPMVSCCATICRALVRPSFQQYRGGIDRASAEE